LFCTLLFIRLSPSVGVANIIAIAQDKAGGFGGALVKLKAAGPFLKEGRVLLFWQWLKAGHTPPVFF
jgi:hypothetical protein